MKEEIKIKRKPPETDSSHVLAIPPFPLLLPACKFSFRKICFENHHTFLVTFRIEISAEIKAK